MAKQHDRAQRGARPSDERSDWAHELNSTPLENVVPFAAANREPENNLPQLRLRVPRRLRVQSARLEFPLLEDDLERLATNAATIASVFHHIHRQAEDLRRTELRDGANSAIRRALLAQIYAAVNDVSRHANPYRRAKPR